MKGWTEATVLSNTHLGNNLYSLRLEADIKPFVEGQSIRLGLSSEKTIHSRRYGIASSPGSSEVQFYVTCKPSGYVSPWLCGLEVGDKVWMTRQAEGSMVLEPIPDNIRVLWMFAEDVGVSPFLSMLKSRELWDRFEKVVLVHEASSSPYLVQKDTLMAYAERNSERFAYVPIVSGAQEAYALSGQTPQLIRDGLIEMIADETLEPDRQFALLCGPEDAINRSIAELLHLEFRRHYPISPGHILSLPY